MNVKFTVTDALGRIWRTGNCPADQVPIQAGPDQTVHDGEYPGDRFFYDLKAGRFQAKPQRPDGLQVWDDVENVWKAEAVPLKVARDLATARVNAGYTQATLAISAGYPAAERESWPVQTSEARALQLDAAAATPWIDAAAAARGIDRLDLASRILTLDLAYRSTHGELSGVRQRLEREIALAVSVPGLMAIRWPADAGSNPSPAKEA